MRVKGYDGISFNSGILLDLPFLEGSGNRTHDIAKPHHEVSLVGPPAWDKVIASNIDVLNLDGITDYLECPAADTADLDFTSGDYSLSCWVNAIDTGTSAIVMGRYGLDQDGWEVYFTNLGFESYLTLRHHHAGLAPDTRDGCYSVGWAPGNWWLLGISRAGLYPIHYRNGVPLAMVYDAGGVKDPDSANRDLVIGARFTKNANFLHARIKKMRSWPRAFSAADWHDLFEAERALYGV